MRLEHDDGDAGGKASSSFDEYWDGDAGAVETVNCGHCGNTHKRVSRFDQASSRTATHNAEGS